MTNIEIIQFEKQNNNLNPDCELHTYAIWKSLGYQVQKGQKAIINTKLWKMIDVKDKKTGKKQEKMILCNASLFSYEQVKRIEE